MVGIETGREVVLSFRFIVPLDTVGPDIGLHSTDCSPPLVYAMGTLHRSIIYTDIVTLQYIYGQL